MPERVGRAAAVGGLQAQDQLNRLAGYVEHLDGVRGAALRDLRARHSERPLPAVEAYRLAWAALGAGVEAFASWSASSEARWGYWRTREGDEMRARVRLVAPEM